MIYLFLFILFFTFAQAQNPYMLAFDGGDYVHDSGINTINHQTGFFSFWIEPDDVTNTQVLCFYGRNDVTNRWVRVYIAGTGKLGIAQRDNDVSDAVESDASTIATGTKYHVVAGSDGSDFLLWLNGVAKTLNVASGTNSGDWLGDVTGGAGAQNLALGVQKTTGLSLQYNGDLDEVVFSSTTPTLAIAQDIYNGGTPKDESTTALYTIVSYWKLNEGTGQTASDEQATYDLTLGATSGVAADDPTWTASSFGWDAGIDFLGFKTHKSFSKFKGF